MKFLIIIDKYYLVRQYRTKLLALRFYQIFRTTNDDGRMGDFIPCEDFSEGVYKMVFNTKPYFERQNVTTFYPYVEVK